MKIELSIEELKQLSKSIEITEKNNKTPAVKTTDVNNHIKQNFLTSQDVQNLVNGKLENIKLS